MSPDAASWLALTLSVIPVSVAVFAYFRHLREQRATRRKAPALRLLRSEARLTGEAAQPRTRLRETYQEREAVFRQTAP